MTSPGEAPAPTLSLIVPAYNGRPLLEACLRSVLAQTRLPDEIVVVDDAGAEDCGWVAEAFPDQPRLRVLRNDRNLGFAASANRGIGAARGAFLALVNQDVELDAEWCAKLLAVFDDPGVASAASRIVLHADPERLDSAGDGYMVSGGALRIGHGQPLWAGGAKGEVFSASAAAAMYRRAALEALPALHGWPFDEDLEAYYEDVDLGFRLRLAGHTCVYEPAATARHHGAASYGARTWRYHYLSSRNGEMVFWSNMPWRKLLPRLPARAVYLAAQAAHKLGQGRFLAWLFGKLAFLERLPRVVSRRKKIRAAAKVSHERLEAAMTKNWLRAPVKKA